MCAYLFDFQIHTTHTVLAVVVWVFGYRLEVLAALEQDSCDLILMDIHMPECSGIEATERICR